MASSSSSRSPQQVKQWRPRQYVLTGMVIVLAASTVVIVTSIVLRPTNIFFSVANFSITNTTTSTTYDPRIRNVPESKRVAFNLTAYNPSRRAQVLYRRVVVSMQLENGGRPSVRKTSVPARLTRDDEASLRQAARSHKSIAVEAFLDNQLYGFFNNSNASATVNVIAQVKFKVGLAASRRYNIRVKCARIDLSAITIATIANCSDVY
ncbi:hypothetical protein EJB05_54092, partial [Eragrostis curvula]